LAAALMALTAAAVMLTTAMAMMALTTAAMLTAAMVLAAAATAIANGSQPWAARGEAWAGPRTQKCAARPNWGSGAPSIASA